MKCPHCGQNNSDKSKFCFKCGKSLKEAGSTPQNRPVNPQGAPLEDNWKQNIKQQPYVGQYTGPVNVAKKKRVWPIILLIIVLVFVIGLVVGAIIYLIQKSGKEDIPEVPTAEATEATTEATEATTEEPATTEEENSPVYIANQYSYRAESVIGEYNGHAYAVMNFDKLGLDSFDEIEAFCEEMGGHMVVIESKEENDYVYSLLTGTIVGTEPLRTALIGYSDARSEGDWRWVNGSTSTYTNWCRMKGKEQPNNGRTTTSKKSEDYAEFFKESGDGSWNDAGFRVNTYRFICEWE